MQITKNPNTEDNFRKFRKRLNEWFADKRLWAKDLLRVRKGTPGAINGLISRRDTGFVFDTFEDVFGPKPTPVNF